MEAPDHTVICLTLGKATQLINCQLPVVEDRIIKFIRPGQVDSKFIVPTCMRFQEQCNIFIIYYSSHRSDLLTIPHSAGDRAVEQFCTGKITLWGTNEMIIQSLELPKIVDKFMEVSTNSQKNAQVRHNYTVVSQDFFSKSLYFETGYSGYYLMLTTIKHYEMTYRHHVFFKYL